MPPMSREEIIEQFRQSFTSRSLRSGFLKIAILKLVSERPMHGYALMKEIERITGMSWKPSPGSIYPTLQELQDAGLVAQREEGRKRVYELTPHGAEVLAAALEQVRAAIVTLQNLIEYRYE